MRIVFFSCLFSPLVLFSQFTTIQLPTTAVIRDIACKDSLCIASDNRESLFISKDYFHSQRSIKVPALDDEYKIRFRYWDDSTYYALMASGGASLFRCRVLKSTDYGETWEALWDQLGTIEDFTLLNDSTIIIVGLGGRRFYTTDFGSTWIDESILYDPSFVVEAYSDSVIIIGKFEGTISTSNLFTTKFGASTGPGLLSRSIAFNGAGMSYLATSTNQQGKTRLFKSSNWGDTWEVVGLWDNYNIWQLAFQDSLIGYASGKYIPQDTGMVFTTIDGGETWDTSVRVPTNRQLLSIAVANDTTVLIGATGGKLFRWNPRQWTTDLASATPPFSLSLQPNPASATQQLSIQSDSYGQATISIYDIHGRLIEYIPSSIIMPGEQTISVDISSWPAGIYVYRVEMNGEYVTLKGQKV